MKRTAGVIGVLVAIVVVVLAIVLLHEWQQNYAATYTDSFDARETVTIHFLDTDRYVEFDNAQIVYSGHDRILVTEDNQRIQIVNAEIIYDES